MSEIFIKSNDLSLGYSNQIVIKGMNLNLFDEKNYQIIGKNGALFVKYGEEIKVGQKNWKQYHFRYKSSPPSSEHNLQGFVNELKEFVQSIKEKRTPLVSGIDGKKNVQIILAMYESFKTKKVVKI